MDDSLTYTDLGRYRLTRRIGRGGMGEVWLADDPRLRRQVAIKVLPLRKRDDQEFLTRFEREARAAAALHHPHILPVHDYGQQMHDDQAVTYLVMSYVSGGSIDDRLKTLASGQGTLTQDQALAYLSQVAEAIDYAHTHGIIHRDIKPANMLLREDGWLLLTDFGIARLLTDGDSATRTGAYLGTPTYMAPEQAQGQAVPASDLYSLAVVAYQLFTGRVPFFADNPYALTFQHAFAAPPSPRAYNPSLSPQFETALLCGLAKDPTRRPFSATTFVTGLRQALDVRHPAAESTVVSTRPISQDAPAPIRTRRVARRRVLIGAGAGVLLLGGGAAAYAFGSLTRHGPATLKSTPTTTNRGTSPGAPMIIAAAFSQPVTQMAWSPTKNVLLTMGADAAGFNQSVGKLWSIPVAGQSNAPSQLATHEFNSGDSTDNGVLIAWSPDGTKLAMANAGLSSLSSETLIYAADLSAPVPGLPEKTISTTGKFQGVGWLSNTSLVTLETATNVRFVLKIWHIEHPQQPPLAATVNLNPILDATDTFNALALSPNGSIMAITAASDLNNGVQVGQVNLTGKQATWHALSPLLSLQAAEVNVIGWSADGRFVAAANNSHSFSGPFGIWDSTQQYAAVQPAPDLSKLLSVPSCFAWGPASQKHLLAIAGTGGQVGLWEVGGSTAPLRLLPGSIAGAVTSLAWSADGQWLAAGYTDSAASILIWRIDNSHG